MAPCVFISPPGFSVYPQRASSSGPPRGSCALEPPKAVGSRLLQAASVSGVYFKVHVGTGSADVSRIR